MCKNVQEFHLTASTSLRTKSLLNPRKMQVYENIFKNHHSSCRISEDKVDSFLTCTMHMIKTTGNESIHFPSTAIGISAYLWHKP